MWNRAADRESGPLHMTDCRDYTLAGFKINSLVCGTVETKGSRQTAALYIPTNSRNTIDEPFTTSENVQSAVEASLVGVRSRILADSPRGGQLGSVS